MIEVVIVVVVAASDASRDMEKKDEKTYRVLDLGERAPRAGTGSRYRATLSLLSPRRPRSSLCEGKERLSEIFGANATLLMSTPLPI